VNVLDSLKSISSSLSKPLSSAKYKTITEESIRAQLEDTTWSLSTSDSAINSLSEKQFNVMYSRVHHSLKMDVSVANAIGKPAVAFLLGIDKNLIGKARNLGLYRALLQTSKELSKMVTSLQDNLPMIFVDKSAIVMNDIQVSHTIYFGAIESAQIYSSMNGYLLAVFSHILSMKKSGTDSLPKYMTEYLVKNGPVYVELINQMCSNGDTAISQITSLRKQGTDFRLAGNGGVQSGINPLLEPAMPILAAIAKSVWTYVGVFAATAIIAYPWLSEAYVDYRHLHYERLKERKKWLESHIANIKLELEGADPNDPDMVKNMKIIAFYDDEIANLDRKINSYYEE